MDMFIDVHNRGYRSLRMIFSQAGAGEGREVTICGVYEVRLGALAGISEPLGFGVAIRNPIDPPSHKGFTLAAQRAMSAVPGFDLVVRSGVYRAILQEHLGDRAPIQKGVLWSALVQNIGMHSWEVRVFEDKEYDIDGGSNERNMCSAARASCGAERQRQEFEYRGFGRGEYGGAERGAESVALLEALQEVFTDSEQDPGE